MSDKTSRTFVLPLIGMLSVLTPFSIDMYLTAFQNMAEDFSVNSATVSLTLSSYFIGLALGQVYCGPLLDRFGRKPPVYVGLAIYILASLACGFTTNIHALIAFRFLQAIGGCFAQVAALAMVRDFFPPQDCAKIISRLFLFIAVSPLLAPTVGGMLIMASSWRAVFFALALVAAIMLTLIALFLPEGHKPDKGISLKLGPILKEYMVIMRHPRFATFALAGAFSFAGLFTYVAGSPIIFMEGFHLSAAAYSGVFAILTTGFIGSSQLNGVLLQKMSSEELFARALMVQVACGIVFVIGAAAGWYGFYATMVLFFIFLSCVGIIYPNAAAVALIPFTRNAGSAAALLGFLQLGLGSLISSGIGFFMTKEAFPVVAILAITASLGLIIFMVGKKHALAAVAVE